MLTEEPEAWRSTSGSINTSLCSPERFPLPLWASAAQGNKESEWSYLSPDPFSSSVIFSHDMPSSVLVSVGALENQQVL